MVLFLVVVLKKKLAVFVSVIYLATLSHSSIVMR